MLPYNNQQLNTPYEHGVAFLLRLVNIEDIEFIRQLRHVSKFDDLHVADQIEFCRLLGKHGFFDDPGEPEETLAELLERVKFPQEGGEL